MAETNDVTQGRTKTLRGVFSTFADITAMSGVIYIRNAKLLWTKIIWAVLLFLAIVAMAVHLGFSFAQYYRYPVQTKISLGFDALPFPEITICNANLLNQRRLDEYDKAEKLKVLIDSLRPETIVPTRFANNSAGVRVSVI